jgi:hypothetical protein
VADAVDVRRHRSAPAIVGLDSVLENRPLAQCRVQWPGTQYQPRPSCAHLPATQTSCLCGGFTQQHAAGDSRQSSKHVDLHTCLQSVREECQVWPRGDERIRAKYVTLNRD